MFSRLNLVCVIRFTCYCFAEPDQGLAEPRRLSHLAVVGSLEL